MKEFFQWIFVGLLVVVVVLGLAWAFTGNDFFVYRYFAPKTEAVRRTVFKESQAYNDGVVQDLQNLRLEFLQSHDAQVRSALASVVLQRSAVYPEDRMPDDLRNFIESLKTGSEQ